MKELEIRLIPARKVYYSSSSNWGVFSCWLAKDVDDSVRKLIKLDEYKRFTLIGSMPELKDGITYKAKVKEIENKKYGKQYEVVFIYREISNTKEGQEEFLRSILAPSYCDELIRVYGDEDIVQLIREDKIDASKLKGIGETRLKEIKNKVVENIYLHDVVTELAEYQLNFNTIKKLVDMLGSPELVVETLKENPYYLTKLNGYGFKRVDNIAMRMGFPKESPHRIQSAMEYVLKDNANKHGHVWIKKKDFFGEVSDLTGLTWEEVNKFLTDESHSIYYDKDRVSLHRYFEYEMQIAKKMKELLEAENQIEITSMEESIKKAEEKQGFEYNEDQRKAIKAVCENNVVLITGKAGTGKSTALRGIVSVLRDSGYMIGICAFAGKAAKRAEETAGHQAKTIHRLLEYNPVEGFRVNKHNPLFYNAIIVDEMSMVDGELFYRLVTSVKNGSKLILLGDTEQLPPIGISNVFKDLIESKLIPHVELSKVMRQAEKSGVLVTANQIRDGVKVFNKSDYKKKVIGELKDLYYIPEKDDQEVFKRIVELAKKYEGDIMDFQVILPMKKRGLVCTDNMNKVLQDIFNPHDGKSMVWKYGEIEYRIGDKVIQNVNNYDTGIMNGNIGRIKNIFKDESGNKKMIINFDGEEVEYSSPEEVKDIGLAYALSGHKLQGSQAPFCVIGVTYSSYILLSRQWLYTALTRTTKRCFLVGQPSAIALSISKSLSDKRNTFLVELLKETSKSEVLA